MEPSRRSLVTLASTVALLDAAGLSMAVAQQGAPTDYPSRPLLLVVPYPPGGGADVIARAVAKGLGDALKQPVVVENKPGGSGQIAAAYVAKAPPDGYTLLLNADSIYSINPALLGKPAQEALAGLAPVANLAGAPVVIAVATAGPVPLRTLADVVALARKRDVPLSYASPGNGTPHHLIAQAISRAAGIRLTHVPYRGTGPALTDLVGGQVDLLFGMPASLQPMVAAGKIRILAVTSFETFPLLPTTPTVASSFPGIGMSTVDTGLAVPARTPPSIIRRLNEEAQKLLANRDLRATMHENGMVPLSGSPDDYRRRMAAARQERERMIHESGVRPE